MKELKVISSRDAEAPFYFLWNPVKELKVRKLLISPSLHVMWNPVESGEGIESTEAGGLRSSDTHRSGIR